MEGWKDGSTPNSLCLPGLNLSVDRFRGLHFSLILRMFVVEALYWTDPTRYSPSTAETAWKCFDHNSLPPPFCLADGNPKHLTNLFMQCFKHKRQTFILFYEEKTKTVIPLPCLVLSCLVMSCIVLSCLVFSSYLSLSCLVFSFLALTWFVRVQGFTTTRQNNTTTRQDNGKTKQEKVRQVRQVRQDKTRQDKTRQDKTRQDKARQERVRGPSWGTS